MMYSFKSLFAIGTVSIVFSLASFRIAAAQSLKENYENQKEQINEFLRIKAEKLVEPLKNIEICYDLPVSDAPYVCKIKNSKEFLMVYGPEAPIGYYKGNRIEGEFHGLNGYRFTNLDEDELLNLSLGLDWDGKYLKHSCWGNLSTNTSTSFTVSYSRTPFCVSWETPGGPWECHIDIDGPVHDRWAGYCYINEDGQIIKREFGKITVKEVVKNLGPKEKDRRHLEDSLRR